MKKQKKRKKKKTRKDPAIKAQIVIKSAKPPQTPTASPLDILAEKRTGGAESHKGFIFQCQCAAWKMMTHLAPSNEAGKKSVRLEGVEDIDIRTSTDGEANEYIQAKSSKNRMDAGKFWSEYRILQNFAEVYIKDPKSRFRLVHDMPFSEGHLSRLDQACGNREPLSEEDMQHWRSKFDEFRKQQEENKKKDNKKEVWNWLVFDLSEFLKRIAFEKTSETELSDKICRFFIKHYQIAEGNEEQYLRALYWNVFLWSRDRAVVRHEDVLRIVEAVREDIAKGPANPAVRSRWLSRVSFELPEKESRYFEGKSARPHDIAAGLPATRKKWEREILDAFEKADVTLIRASSGQGKSTLAWQTAFHLADNGWHPYELHWCGDAREIGNIITFIESRIKIGETPLVVIDGLSPIVSEWGELTRRTLDLPVKYIVTVREEDWYRFGADQSRLRLIPVTIEMDQEEAGDIYEQFRKAGKLQSKGMKWQTAWERVRNRGLLIEYVYLLTQGTMMEERLYYQVQSIEDEKNSAEKLEILRLVSVADLCGVRLPSIQLIESVRERVGFRSDRGETLKSLEREYQILIEDRMYAEGLHPVRSWHLAEILHEALPMAETLVNLLAVIEPESLHEFCAHAPLLVEGKQRLLFLEKLAFHVAGKTYADMVRVIDGLFSTDAKQNWEVNREIYDDLSLKGVVNEVIVLNAFPWSGVDTFKDLAGNDAFRKSIEEMKRVISNMTPFEPEKSDTLLFIKTLSDHLARHGSIKSIRTFGRLAQWHSRFDLEFPLLDFVDESVLWQAINTLDLKDAGELLNAYHSAYPEKYRAFVDKNKPEIIGLLKRRTNTLTIIENGENLQIKYLTHGDGKELNLNDESVKRAEVIGSVLPYFEEYDVNGIYPPIPGMDLYTKTHDPSEKRLEKKWVGNKFGPHVNRIWIDSIMANYESASVFEWQKQWYDLRINSLDLADVCLRFIEANLDGKEGKAKTIAEKLDKIRPSVLHLLSIVRKFPKKADCALNDVDLKTQIKAISDWSVPLRNFFQHFSWLLKGDDREKNFVNVNIQDALRKLGHMQTAFKMIMESTFPYFDVNKPDENEKAEYTRLARTVVFYLSNLNNIGRISNIRFSVTDWWDRQEKNRINGIKRVLSEFENISDFEFVPPISTIDNNGLRETAIGIRGWTFRQLDEENLTMLIFGLTGLADVDITYFHLVAIKGNCAENNAFRISRDFFEKLPKALESGEESVDFGYAKPLPVQITKELLETLPGISMGKEVEENIGTSALGNILMQLWRLSEIRKRLSKEEKAEEAWRRELEQECERLLDENMKIVDTETSEDVSLKYRTLIKDVVSDNKVFDSDDFQRYFIEISASFTT